MEQGSFWILSTPIALCYQVLSFHQIIFQSIVLACQANIILKIEEYFSSLHSKFEDILLWVQEYPIPLDQAL